MKLGFIASIIFVAAGLWAASWNENRIEVTFPKNTGLEMCIRQNMASVYMRPIYMEDALLLTEISCNGSDITSLEGIEVFTNLISIDFGYHGTKIDNLSYLSTLTKLKTLRIAHSDITDIAPLKELALINLDLSANHVTDLTPLDNMTSLTTLYLYHQGPDYITDISPLANLTELYVLDLEANKISDITPLKGLLNLRYLHLKDNRIADISSLSELTELSLVNVSLNMLTDLTPLTSSKSISALYANNNRITSVEFAAELNKITHLGLNRNRISDISQLKELREPTLLSLDMNNITSIEPLERHMAEKRIKELGIAYNCIEDLYLYPLYFVKNVRQEHQCETPPTPSELDKLAVVNGDLLEGGTATPSKPPGMDDGSYDNLTSKLSAPTGPGGCSLGKDNDIFFVFIGLLLLVIRGLERFRQRNKQTDSITK
jgi:Leucine-rich repeat (LRR) protein